MMTAKRVPDRAEEAELQLFGLDLRTCVTNCSRSAKRGAAESKGMFIR